MSNKCYINNQEVSFLVYNEVFTEKGRHSKFEQYGNIIIYIYDDGTELKREFNIIERSTILKPYIYSCLLITFLLYIICFG